MFSRKPIPQERKNALGINSITKEWVHDTETNVAIFRFKSFRAEIPGGTYETYLIYVDDNRIAVDAVVREDPGAAEPGQLPISDISYDVQKIVADDDLQPRVSEISQLIHHAFEAYGVNGYLERTGDVTIFGNSIEKIHFM
jgi:hypothetical protein